MMNLIRSSHRSLSLESRVSTYDRYLIIDNDIYIDHVSITAGAMYSMVFGIIYAYLGYLTYN